MTMSLLRSLLKTPSLTSFVTSTRFQPVIFSAMNLSTKIPEIATYAEIKELPKKQEVYLFDVREPNEIKETGAVPTAINIPLGQVAEKLSKNFSDKNFEETFKRKKPAADAPLIFMCKIGKRSQKALEIAQSLGYKNGRNYLGSWDDWYKNENPSK